MRSQQYTLKQTIAPATEPLARDTDVKPYLWIDSSFAADDTLLTGLIQAARERCERVTGLQLITATWRMSLDQCPGLQSWKPYAQMSGYGWNWLRQWEVVVPRPPLQAVSAITFVDYAGVTQTWTSTLYQVDADSKPARIYPAYGQIWPQARYQFNAVQITYTAGFGVASAVPQDLKDRMLACVKYCYDNRDNRDEEFLDNLFRGHWHGWQF